MGSGAHINTTEDRAVMHVALRAPANKQIFVDGKDVVPDVHEVLTKINAFAAQVRSDKWLGATGKPIRNVISVGIGGSYLGPEFVYEALRSDPEGRETSKGRRLRFLANVDPVDVFRAVQGCDPEETLVVIVSKTFTTAETMLNAKTLKEWLLTHIFGTQSEIIAKHMVAVRYTYLLPSHLIQVATPVYSHYSVAIS
jgi:glucose-6-phosphate isomerase